VATARYVASRGVASRGGGGRWGAVPGPVATVPTVAADVYTDPSQPQDGKHNQDRDNDPEHLRPPRHARR
jgi:hypothetical protein